MSFMIYLIAFLPAFLSAYTYDLAMCAIFRNEAFILKEWLEFHKLVGVQHFYLYNNFSDDNSIEVLSPYIENGEVELIEWNHPHVGMVEWSSVQCSAFDDAIQRTKGVAKWLSFLDLDEFLFAAQKDSLVDFLKEYEEFGSVSANWQLYGTSFVSKIPDDKLLIETLLIKGPTDLKGNHLVKTIVRPERAVNASQHFCYLQGDFKQVTANKESFFGPCAPTVDVSKLRINHYWTRDEYYFNNVKISRRLMLQEAPEKNSITLKDKLNAVRDESILRFVPKLREKLLSQG